MAPYAEVIGDPIAHSKSPLIHQFWLGRLGIDGDYRRERVRVDTLHHYFSARRSDACWRGCNLTMPLKQAVLPFLSGLSAAAERCGAVNCVLTVGENRLAGHNTDSVAVAELLETRGRIPGPDHVGTVVQIIGAGGAARAAVHGAVQAGYRDFQFYNRTQDGARTMAFRAGLDPDRFASSLEAIGPIRKPGDGPKDQPRGHVIINATALGMDGQPELEVDLSRYHPDTIVIDMPYAEGGTAFARQARLLGLRIFDGHDVLIAQAAAAFELFFGRAAPREHDRELRERVTS